MGIFRSEEKPLKGYELFPRWEVPLQIYGEMFLMRFKLHRRAEADIYIFYNIRRRGVRILGRETSPNRRARGAGSLLIVFM